MYRINGQGALLPMVRREASNGIGIRDAEEVERAGRD